MVCDICETGEQLGKHKQPDISAGMRVVSRPSSGSNTVSLNSLPSQNAASDTNTVRSTRKPEARGAELSSQLPQHTVYRPDQFSLKSCSTTSQLSTVADKYEYSTISLRTHAI